MAGDIYELGCFLYKKSLLKEDAYKLNDDKWCFFSMAEVHEFFKDPIEEKVSGHQKLYNFNFKDVTVNLLKAFSSSAMEFFL